MIQDAGDDHLAALQTYEKLPFFSFYVMIGQLSAAVL